jgi:hypothetical protein
MYGGLDAVEHLLERRYKIQTLSVSHYNAHHHNSERYKLDSRQILEKYGPNSLFQSVEDVKEMLRWGADSADTFSENNFGQKVFTAYLFATQGLDLAIPSATTYVEDVLHPIDPLKGFDMDSTESLKGCPKPEENNEMFDLYFEKVSAQQ